MGENHSLGLIYIFYLSSLFSFSLLPGPLQGRRRNPGMARDDGGVSAGDGTSTSRR